MATRNISVTRLKKATASRKGIHAKSKSSKSKTSKIYFKRYRGQGR